MGAKLLTGGILAVIGLFTIKLVFAVLSGIAALIGFLLFTVLPIVLVGWILMKIFRRTNGEEAFE